MISAVSRRPATLFKSGGDSPLRNGGGREIVDINSNNSPGHSSSQDGSFIQDEDMHLILEFGGLALPKNVIMQPQTISDDRLQQQPRHHVYNNLLYQDVANNRKSAFDCCTTMNAAPPPSNDPMFFDNRDGDRRLQVEWAKKFDADIVAQMDFDDFSAQRDMALLNGDDLRYKSGSTPVDYLYNNEQMAVTRKKTPRFNDRRKILRTGDSMETSLLFDVNGECLSSLIFSSSSSSSNCGVRPSDENENFFIDNGNLTILDNDFSTTQSDAFKDKPQPPGPFISTDSLDFSSLSLTEENLRQACATNKREYVLTFDKNAFESGLAIFSTETCMDDSYVSQDNIRLQIRGRCENNDDGQEFTSQNLVILDAENQDKNDVKTNNEGDQCVCGINIISIGKTPEFDKNLDQSHIDDNCNNNIVTWGRIKRSYEKPENSNVEFNHSSKFVSLPNLKKSNLLTDVVEEENYQPIDEETTTQQKRLSLLQVFQENQQQQALHKNYDNESGYITGVGSNVNENFAANEPPPFDYFATEKNLFAKECVEQTNVEHQRYVDLNHNEIDYYVPPFVVKDTSSERKAPAKPLRTFVNQNFYDQEVDSYVPPQLIDNNKEENVQNSPNLDFLKFPFEVPPLDMQMTPFLTDFINNTIKKSNLVSSLENPRSFTGQILQNQLHDAPKLANNRNNLYDDHRIATAGPGPEHIEDWDSLAILLPNSVVKTCQFFHQNSKFRGDNIDKCSKSSQILDNERSYLETIVEKVEHKSKSDNFNDKLAFSEVWHGKMCHKSHYQRSFYRKKFNRCHCCCCCSFNHDQLERWKTEKLDDVNVRIHDSLIHDSCSTKQNSLRDFDLDIDENRIRSLSALVERIIRGVDVVEEEFQSAEQEADVDNAKSSGGNWSIGAAVFDSLCPALECLLIDGLKPDKSICDVMKTSSDDITRSVCSLIAGGNNNKTSRIGGKTRERSMQFAVFVDGLLSSKSLNLWLEKMISDRKALDEIYARTSYVFYLSTKFCSNLTEKLTTNLKRLNNLRFDKVNLIDMDIDVDDHQERHSKFNTAGNRFSSLFRRSSSTKNQNENSLVLLQKELKIVFRFPAKIVLETKKERVGTKKNDKLSPQNESRIPRNVSPSSSSAFRLDIRLHSPKNSPSSSRPPSAIPSPTRKKSSPSPLSNSPTSKRSAEQQKFTSKIARFLKNSPSTPTKTSSRIPLPNNNNNNNYRLPTNLHKKQ